MASSKGSTERKRAIVIGAGTGGIATAARLAKAGFAVTVVEKNDFVGGRCSLMRTADGFRFDQGPSLLLLPGFFRTAFHELDTSLEAEGVELLRCATNYDIWFADGARFRSSTDTARMKAEIERWEGKGGFERYLAFLAEAHRHYETSVTHILKRNFTSVLQMADPRFVWPALALHPLESMWSRAGRYFWSERLRRVFTFATMYMGMSPFDAPSTYSLLQYTEVAEGIWYPRGGFQTVLEALAGVGRRLGVEYRLSAPVARISASPDGRRATGVVLASGEELAADVVVVNADLVYAYGNLLPQTRETAAYARGLRARDASCSSISFYWSVSRKVPELGVHNIFMADEYRESFDAIFKRQTLPDDPSFYVNVPSRIDPSAAPDGCDAIIALVPVGHLLRSRGSGDDEAGGLGLDASAQQEWAELVAKARAAVLAAVRARTGCEPLEKYITSEIVNTPPTWEDKFNLDKGAILGLSHSFLNVLGFRPRTRARGLENAYFVGASTHPGTGVPIVLAGAKITTEEILADHGIRPPWWGKPPAVQDQGVAQTPKTSELDRIRRPLWMADTSLMLVLLFLVSVTLAYMYGSSSQARFVGDW